jgi:hypothetical protein
MTMPIDSTQLDAYVPVYDAIPEKWDDARVFLVERMKEITNALNIREIGWLLDEELLSGKQFIPSSTNSSGTQGQFRSVLRIVVDVHPLVAGLNTFPHGVTFDANLTLIDSWVSATNSSTLEAITMVYPEVEILGPNVLITSPGSFDRAFFFFEYIQEV